MRSAVFLERDGILNGARVERNAPLSPRTLEEFKMNLSAREPLLQLKDAGFVLIAITNQPGISRGYQSRRETDLMHTLLMSAFPLDEIAMCPHDEMDHCPCRKPRPGLITEAAFKWQLDLDRSFVVSDKWQDAQAAHNAGCASLLIRSPWNGNGHHDFVLADLESAVGKVLQLQSQSYMPLLAS